MLILEGTIQLCAIRPPVACFGHRSEHSVYSRDGAQLAAPTFRSRTWLPGFWFAFRRAGGDIRAKGRQPLTGHQSSRLTSDMVRHCHTYLSLFEDAMALQRLHVRTSSWQECPLLFWGGAAKEVILVTRCGRKNRRPRQLKVKSSEISPAHQVF